MFCCCYIYQTPVQVVLSAQAKETSLLIPQGVWVSRRCFRKGKCQVYNMRAFREQRRQVERSSIETKHENLRQFYLMYLYV